MTDETVTKVTLTPEDQARAILDRVVESGERWSAGEVVEIANIIAELQQLRAERDKYATIKAAMKSYDDAPNDGEFRGDDHPIVRLALENDTFRARIAALEAENEALRDLAPMNGPEIAAALEARDRLLQQIINEHVKPVQDMRGKPTSANVCRRCSALWDKDSPLTQWVDEWHEPSCLIGAIREAQNGSPPADDPRDRLIADLAGNVDEDGFCFECCGKNKHEHYCFVARAAAMQRGGNNGD